MPRKPVPVLARALNRVNDASIAVDDWIEAVGDDTPALAEAFASIDDTIRILAQCRDIVKASLLRRSKWESTEDWAGFTLDGKRFPYLLPGGGYMVRRGGKEATRYDQPKVIAAYAEGITNELLAEDVAARVLDSSGTIIPLATVVERVCARFAEGAGATAPSFTNWRSGIATKLGIDIKPFAETKTSDVTLSVEGRRAS